MTDLGREEPERGAHCFRVLTSASLDTSSSQHWLLPPLLERALIWSQERHFHVDSPSGLLGQDFSCSSLLAPWPQLLQGWCHPWVQTAQYCNKSSSHPC